MAIVQMQRINICALKKNRKAILERLQELGAMEVDIRLEDEELCEKQDVSSSRSTFERRSQTAARHSIYWMSMHRRKKECWTLWRESR